MPNYWNPSNFYPVTYPQYTSVMPQQSYSAQSSIAAAWVEGEMEARGRQMPQGVNQFYMFDAGKQKIYLKSLNPMGMPNPMQILDYTIEEQPQANLLSGNGENMSGAAQPDMSQYVTKQDFEELKNEIQQMHQNQSGNNYSGASNNQNGNNYSGNNYSNNNSNNSGQNGNRGGNR